MNFKSLIVEATLPSANGFLDTLARCYVKDWKRDIEKWGHKDKSISDISWILEKFKHDPYYKQGWYGFIYQALQNKSYTINNFSNVKGKCSSIRGACYYNALDYILSVDDDSTQLAYGILLSPDFFDYIAEYSNSNSPIKGYQVNYSWVTAPHAFILVNGNRILDPTLKKLRDTFYFWNVVPEGVSRTFNHKSQDPNFDAKDFYKYIEKQVLSEKPKGNITSLVKKYIVN